MKSISFLIPLCFAIFACKDSTPAPRNFVVESVQAIDPDMKCVPYFTGEGPTALHSARCKLADKSLAYCRLSADMKIMECGPLFPVPKAEKAEKTEQAPASVSEGAKAP